MHKFMQYKPFEITTVQKTKRFCYSPTGGWKRGVDYSEIESTVLAEIREKLHEGVKLTPGSGRYFEYYFSTCSTESKDCTESLVHALNVCSEITEKYNLEIKHFA